MSVSTEAAIREYPAATHTAVCQSFLALHTDAQRHSKARKDASLSNDNKTPCVMLIRVINPNPADSQIGTALPAVTA